MDYPPNRTQKQSPLMGNSNLYSYFNIISYKTDFFGISLKNTAGMNILIDIGASWCYKGKMMSGRSAAW